MAAGSELQARETAVVALASGGEVMSTSPGATGRPPSPARELGSESQTHAVRLGRFDVRGVRWIAPALLLVLGAGVIYHLTRSTTFWFDEWTWITTRRGNNVGTFLDSYNGHFSLVPLAIYRLLFATAGLKHYAPYRIAVIAGHLTCTALVGIYVRRRVGELLGCCAAAFVLFLGPGWQNFLWPFQVAWLISLACGIGALLMLERRDRSGDLLACLLLAVSLCSSGIGIVMAVGMVVDLAFGRRRWRSAWVAAIPLALYAAWWLGYQVSMVTSTIGQLPRFVADEVSASMGQFTPFAGDTGFGGAGGLLTWGRPAAVLAALLVLSRLIYLRRIPVRVLTLLATLVCFWLTTAWTRAWLSGTQAWASRYLYVDGLLLVLLASELATGTRIRRELKAVIVAVAVCVVVANVSTLRHAANAVRSFAAATRADLTALQIGRSLTPPGYVATQIPGFPFVQLRSSAYFAAVKALGSPADTPAQLVAEPDFARANADLELIHIDQLALHPARATPHGSCHLLAAPAHGQEVTMGAPGELITTRGAPALLSVRRFGDSFAPLGTVPAGRREVVALSADASSRPWRLSAASSAALTVCALG